tara:strand:- start:932 stop:1081 length:150 start_codon:yes stop_codon:yes gene_type:complete
MQLRKLYLKDIKEIIKLKQQLFNYDCEKKEIIINRINTFNKGCLGINNK